MHTTMRVAIFFQLLLASLLPTLGLAAQARHKTPRIETIFQLNENFTWFENAAVTASGDLLVTRADVPELWTIDPISKTGSLLASIPV